MKNVKKLKEEKEYWNVTAMDLLNSNKKLLFERNEAIKLLNGLLDDFKYFIGESDNEPQRAGFIVAMTKVIKESKEAWQKS